MFGNYLFHVAKFVILKVGKVTKTSQKKNSPLICTFLLSSNSRPDRNFWEVSYIRKNQSTIKIINLFNDGLHQYNEPGGRTD